MKDFRLKSENSITIFQHLGKFENDSRESERIRDNGKNQYPRILPNSDRIGENREEFERN